MYRGLGGIGTYCTTVRLPPQPPYPLTDHISPLFPAPCSALTRRLPALPTVCESIDIRQSINGSEELAQCDVIEGHLKLILIGDTGRYAVRFPRLKQVTHYIIFYR